MAMDYTDLFDLYLDDMLDESTVPEEFIVSSKILFLSNSATTPSKVKPHTLSFEVSTTEDTATGGVLKNAQTIAQDVLDTDIQEEVIIQALEDLTLVKKTKGTLEDFLKVLVIRSSGMPEGKATNWLLKQG